MNPLARTAILLAAFVPTLPAQLNVREFLIPRANAFPHDPAFAADGTCWYTDQQNSYIGRLDPATGVFTDFATPTPGSGPHGICVAPDGFLWYTGQDTGRLGRVNPSTGAITEFVMPANANRPHTPIAHQGGIWFTCQSNQTYGRLDPGTSQVQVYPVAAGSNPYGIFPAPDGSLWIAMFGANRLGRVNPANGSIQLFPLPNAAARPRRLTVTQDGFVWYTDFARGYLGRLDPRNGSVVEWLAPDPPPGPYGIAVGTDGRIWFHSQGANFMIAFDPGTQQFQTVPIPTSGTIVRHMVSDFERGRLWLALSGTRRIGLIQLTAPIARFGQACAGGLGLPAVTTTGAPRVGTTLTVGVTNTAAPIGVLFLGLSRTNWAGIGLPFDLAPAGAPGCFVNTGWEIVLGAGGTTPVPIPLPLDPGLRGSVFLQWALFGEPGRTVVTTEGLALELIGR